MLGLPLEYSVDIILVIFQNRVINFGFYDL
jgi:hypothetical protein